MREIFRGDRENMSEIRIELPKLIARVQIPAGAVSAERSEAKIIQRDLNQEATARSDRGSNPGRRSFSRTR